MPVTLDQVAEAILSTSRRTQPVVAPLVVYGVAVAAAGAVTAAGVGVAQSARERQQQSGVGRGIPQLAPDLAVVGGGQEPGEVDLLPMWRADP